MTGEQLFRAGDLKGAIQALGVEVRDKPTDLKRRTFLFELLCFAGEFERAEKHLNIIADANKDAAIGALLFRSGIHAERQRRAFFDAGEYASTNGSEPQSCAGTLNGEPFTSIEDADPRVGPRVELFLAGEYTWIQFAQLSSLSMEAPKTLRDLLWPQVYVAAGPALKDKDIGSAIAPALYPSSSKHERDTVKLGRETDWVGDVPFGQKLLVLDGERVVPFLEIRELKFDAPQR